MSDKSTVPEKLQTFSQQKARLVELLIEHKVRDTLRIKPFPRLCQDGVIRAPTSAAQQRLWLIDQLEGGGAAYHIAFAFRLVGALDRRALQLALDTIVRRHDSLRTVIVEEEGVPRQLISADGVFELTSADLSGHAQSDREAMLRVRQQEEAQRAFDLSKGPLARGCLVHCAPEHNVLLLTMHHIIFDGWSVAILLRELGLLYQAFAAGRDNPMQPLPIQYSDYAQWQRNWLEGPLLARQLDYWRDHLRNVPPQLELPLDRARPVVQSFRGDNIDLILDAHLSGRLKAFARRHELTVFMVLYAGLTLLLARLSGQHDVVIGTPIANRQHAELEGLIGFFVNTLALRVSVQNDQPLSQFLEQVRAVTLAGYDHGDVPFERVVEELQPERTLSRNPLFQVMLVVLNTPAREMTLPGLTVTQEREVAGPAKFDLLLSLEEIGEQIVGTVNFATDLFDARTIERWMACYLELLVGMTACDPTVAVGDLSILPDREARAIASFNDTSAEQASDKLIHRLFEEQARATPDAVAVVHDDRSMTYAQLNAAADRLARALLRNGAGPDELVGICVERSQEMIAALLGALKAGAAYLPLDPDYPQDRVQYMLADARPCVVLTQRRLIPRLSGSAVKVLLLDELDIHADDDQKAEPVLSSCKSTAENLLYVIYTSGSTGRPKGTAMPHGSMVNLIEWHRRTLSAAGQRVLQFAALSFDVAFQETFSTLCTGGTLFLLDEWIRKDAAALLEFLESRQIHRVFLPPMMLQSLAEAFEDHRGGLSLRDVITAGEQLRIGPDVIKFFKKLPGCRLHNHYGPTETHVVTALTLEDGVEHWPPLPSIGRPIANTQIHILDSRRRALPIGVAGDIYVAGTSLARGYLDRPELTRERFVPNPFDDTSGARMYKTGDVGRWLADGRVEYLGRNDDQVKIRGYRVELGEIETQLERHADVLEAAVIVREDAPGDKRLVAYLVGRDGKLPGAEDLRAHLKETLPDYMLPSAFVQLEKLPVTSNGKLDRRALPKPDAQAYSGRRYEAPQGPVEEVLASIWAELLATASIGRHDNFFEIGGHSLLAVRMLYKVNRAFNCAMRVSEAYRAPTISALAQRIAGRQHEDEYVDLAREAVLDDDTRSDGSLKRSPGAVLLTGATGFIGRFLLAQLLQDTQARMYCMVRAGSRREAEEKLRKTLMKWQLWSEAYKSRIVAVAGDLRQPRLGMREVDYHTLCAEVDSIYHCATSMNHLETYAMAKAANVDAVKELLKLATRERLKLVNNISTLGIFTPSAGGVHRVVHECSPIDGEQHRGSSGYVASKWVAEQLFEIACERGIPCNVFRLGLIWPDTQLGRYDELQHDYRLFKSCLMSGFGIADHRYPAAPVPVDFAARAIVSLSRKYDEGFAKFHIASSSPSTHGVFELCNLVTEASLELLTPYQWVRRIKQMHDAGMSLPIVPLVEYAFSMDEESYNKHRQASQSNSITIECSATQSELEASGLVAPAFGGDLIRVFVRDMLSRDDDLRSIASRKTSSASAKAT